jgi:hypothetical protein
MRILGLVAAALVFCGTAEAAVIRYSMTFEDNDGTTIGTGGFSYDPSLTEDILLTEENFLCSIPDDFCRVVATWTPFTAFYLDFPGFPVGGSDRLFLEGTLARRGRSDEYFLVPDVWSTFDLLDGTGFEITFLGGFSKLGNFSYFAILGGPDDFFEASGRVVFDRIDVIPLPPALWMFALGIGAFVLRRPRIRT